MCDLCQLKVFKGRDKLYYQLQICNHALVPSQEIAINLANYQLKVDVVN